jgi:hypothetical protein
VKRTLGCLIPVLLVAALVSSPASGAGAKTFTINQAQAQRVAELTAPELAPQQCIPGEDCSITAREVRPCKFNPALHEEEFRCPLVQEFTTEGHCGVEVSSVIKVWGVQVVSSRVPREESLQGVARIKVKGVWRNVYDALFSGSTPGPEGEVSEPCA